MKSPFRDVHVQLTGADAPKPGTGFRLCPLGIQFRSETRLEPYSMIQIDVDLPDERKDLPARTLHLQGIVVQCDPVDDGHKVALYFIDLEPEVYDLIRETSQCLPTLCPDCSLF